MLLKSALVVSALTLAELGLSLYAPAGFITTLVTMAVLALSLLGIWLLAGSPLFVGPVRGMAAPLLGSRLVGLPPAGALDGHSFRRRGDVVDVTSTMKDPARSAASPAHPEFG